MPRCSVDGCEKPVRCRDLCHAHYLRMLRHGDTALRRGEAGTGEARQIITLPLRLDRAIRSAAKREGIGLAEWWRRAAQERLARAGRG